MGFYNTSKVVPREPTLCTMTIRCYLYKWKGMNGKDYSGKKEEFWLGLTVKARAQDYSVPSPHTQTVKEETQLWDAVKKL